MNQGNLSLSVKIVVYKKIVEGDLSKFTATSNITPTGGGARDLRFSPASEFFPIFQRMFPRDGSVLKGSFFWTNGSITTTTEVEIHPPTNARPNEVRIGRIHECFPANVIPRDASDCILLIVMDASGKVCPYFTTQRSLIQDNWHPAIKQPILAGLNAHRSAKTTAMGYVDIENGRNFTNGQV